MPLVIRRLFLHPNIYGVTTVAWKSQASLLVGSPCGDQKGTDILQSVVPLHSVFPNKQARSFLFVLPTACCGLGRLGPYFRLLIIFLFFVLSGLKKSKLLSLIGEPVWPQPISTAVLPLRYFAQFPLLKMFFPELTQIGQLGFMRWCFHDASYSF